MKVVELRVEPLDACGWRGRVMPTGFIVLFFLVLNPPLRHSDSICGGVARHTFAAGWHLHPPVCLECSAMAACLRTPPQEGLGSTALLSDWEISQPLFAKQRMMGLSVYPFRDAREGNLLCCLLFRGVVFSFCSSHPYTNPGLARNHLKPNLNEL